MASIKTLIFDLEADGLYEEATRMWCLCAKDSDGNTYEYTPYDIDNMDYLEVFHGVDLIIGHNIIEYDLPLIRKLHGYKAHGKVLDTLALSRLLDPERQGGHSLEAWGERLGYAKVQNEDWSQFTDNMLHRCHVDVEINEAVYKALLKESELTEEEIWENLPVLTF